jgi:hypothetical protein
MTEIRVDWSAPVWIKSFVMLMAQNKASDGELLKWLEKNGYAELAICPQCKGEGFTHSTPGCPIDQIAQTLFGVMEPKVNEFGEELRDAITDKYGSAGIEQIKDTLLTRKQ